MVTIADRDGHDGNRDGHAMVAIAIVMATIADRDGHDCNRDGHVMVTMAIVMVTRWSQLQS